MTPREIICLVLWFRAHYEGLWWRLVRWWDERFEVSCRLCCTELDDQDIRKKWLVRLSLCRDCDAVLMARELALFERQEEKS